MRQVRVDGAEVRVAGAERLAMAQLGGTGIDVYPVALGGTPFGWTSDEATSHRVLDAFIAGGGNFVDTSDSYMAAVPGHSGGESETIIGSWLAARKNRDRVIIGTKVSRHPRFKGLSPANVAAAADASLKRLQTDYIDVYYAHYDDPATPLAETIGAFETLRTTGKIRAVALSNYTGARIAEWLDTARSSGCEPPAVLQPHYNLVTRRLYEREIAPVAASAGLAVVPYFALAAGFLTGKYRKKLGLAPSLALVGALLTGKHRRKPYDFGAQVRQRIASKHSSDAGLAVIDALDGIASGHGVAIATAAIAWLRGRPNVVAPITSARTAEQLPALLAAATLNLTGEEIATLDEISARVG
jgi:aryl-alcohol dehydrogenase-like predicted oxidoreductase